ncbi:MAG TPA: GIDE domain-containing protein [Steroidobacteraceae bacterium]|nr:GIDE domain-containing protein [Steroidobacteraceae bacterium]
MPVQAVHAYWLIASASAAAATYALVRFLASVRRDRFIADTPLARIRSAAQGYVRIEGRARCTADHDAAAPLSGRECVWWDYQIERRVANSRGEKSWQTVERARSVAPFILEDGDSQCLIGPVGADVTPAFHQSWYGDTPRPARVAVAAEFVIGADREFRYTERLIAPAVRLTVLGELRSHADTAETDERVRELISKWKQDQPSLLARFDRDRDGQLSAEEWETARAAARAQVAAATLRPEGGRLSVVGQTTHGEPFLIAPLDGRQLVRREQLFATVSLVASVLLVATTVWAMHKALVSASAVSG